MRTRPRPKNVTQPCCARCRICEMPISHGRTCSPNCREQEAAQIEEFALVNGFDSLAKAAQAMEADR